MWVVKGSGGMWLKKMGEKWEKNGRKNGRNTYVSQSHFPHCRRSKTSRTVPSVKLSPPHSSMEKWEFCHPPTLTATAAGADAWHLRAPPPPPSANPDAMETNDGAQRAEVPCP